MSTIAERLGLDLQAAKAQRSAVVTRWARKGLDGRPLFCRRAHGKVEYRREAEALAAGTELAALPLGVPQRAYQHGDHWHLTSLELCTQEDQCAS